MLTDQLFQEFVRTQSDALFRYAYFLMGKRGDAEDIVQETWIKLWTMRQEVDLNKNPEALVFQMVKNKCLDHLKKSKRYTHRPLEQLSERFSTHTVLTEMEAKESFQALMAFVQTLPDLQRDVLILRNIERQPIEKIAEILDLKKNTVEVYLSRARKKLREAYRKMEKQ